MDCVYPRWRHFVFRYVHIYSNYPLKFRYLNPTMGFLRYYEFNFGTTRSKISLLVNPNLPPGELVMKMPRDENKPTPKKVNIHKNCFEDTTMHRNKNESSVLS